MNKYHLFAGHNSDPRGAKLNRRYTGTLEACKHFFATRAQEIAGGGDINNWAQIVEPDSMRVIEYGKMYTPPSDVYFKGVKIEWDPVVQWERADMHLASANEEE